MTVVESCGSRRIQNLSPLRGYVSYETPIPRGSRPGLIVFRRPAAHITRRRDI
jgi:hypothetical protein